MKPFEYPGDLIDIGLYPKEMFREGKILEASWNRLWIAPNTVNCLSSNEIGNSFFTSSIVIKEYNMQILAK